MTGSAFPMHIGRGTLFLGWLRRITYFSTEPREGKGRGGAHRAEGWRIYVGGGFGSQDASKKVKNPLVL